MDAEFAPTHYHLGRYYLSLGQNEKAFQAFQESTRLDPESAATCLGMGEVY
jgi:cytochrome c-type biogenesis protein CcmH/NrfG